MSKYLLASLQFCCDTKAALADTPVYKLICAPARASPRSECARMCVQIHLRSLQYLDVLAGPGPGRAFSWATSMGHRQPGPRGPLSVIHPRCPRDKPVSTPARSLQGAKSGSKIQQETRDRTSSSTTYFSVSRLSGIVCAQPLARVCIPTQGPRSPNACVPRALQRINTHYRTRP